MDKRAKWCLFIRREAKGAKKEKKNTSGSRNETQYSLRLKALNPLRGLLFHSQNIWWDKKQKNEGKKNKGKKNRSVFF